MMCMYTLIPSGELKFNKVKENSPNTGSLVLQTITVYYQLIVAYSSAQKYLPICHSFDLANLQIDTTF